MAGLSTQEVTEYPFPDGNELAAGIPIDDARTDLIQSHYSFIRTTYFCLSGACVVAFLFWFYRAHQNLTFGGLSSLRYTHGWAVGSFFIPILNFVLPYRAMGEVYKGSLALTEDMDIESWQSLPLSPLVNWWWVLFWARVVSSTISRGGTVESFSEFQRALWMLFASNIIEIPAAFITIVLIRNISKMQLRAQSERFVIRLYPGGV